MKNIKKRWQSETPDFFKKMIKTGIAIGGVGAGILTLPMTAPIVLPAIITNIAGYMIACGSLSAVIGKLTVKDANSLK